MAKQSRSVTKGGRKDMPRSVSKRRDLVKTSSVAEPGVAAQKAASGASISDKPIVSLRIRLRWVVAVCMLVIVLAILVALFSLPLILGKRHG